MAKKATTKYTVRSPKGEIIDTRVSTAGRIYTHAIAARRNENYYKTEAYRWTTQDLKNAEWSWGNAEKNVKAGEDRVYGERGMEQSREILAHGNCMAFVASRRQAKIDCFNKEKAAGRFEKLEVVTYCGRPDLAQKEHLKAAKQPWFDTVLTIEVERS